MDHFQVVSALCRQIIKDGASKGAILQMERLLGTLKEDGCEDQAHILAGLINRANTIKALGPTRVELSRNAYLTSQELTPNAKIPVDRDSGAPLATVLFATDLDELEMPVLSEELSMAVFQLVEQWKNVDKLAAYGVMPTLSCLFFGLPGTGKTKLALYVAQKLGLPVVLTRLDGLVSSLLGTSARNISNLFNFVNQYNCILLLDEFDAVAKARNDAQEVGEIKRIVNTLLQCIDARSKEGMTIAITNHEVLLDPAVWRRFDVRIFVPKPDEAARLQIIERYLPPLDFSQEKKKFLTLVTNGFSGSDIEVMITNFKRHYAISGEAVKFIDLVRSFLTIYAGSDSDFSQLMAAKTDKDFMKEIKEKYRFNQKEIAAIVDTHPSKVSRAFS